MDPRFAPDHARIWWVCRCKSSKCLDTCTHSHDYQASISNRFTKDGDTKTGCPWCSGAGIVLCPCQSLESRFPHLAKEWYQPLNGDLLPSQVFPGSSQVVYWICLREDRKSKCVSGCTEVHVFKARVNHRVDGGGCPYCRNGGKLFCSCQSLNTRFPDVAKQWDYAKNANLLKPLPTDYSHSSNVKVSWICSDCDHQYSTNICEKTRGARCPNCFTIVWEKKLSEILVSMESVLDHGKPSISCFDEILQKQRTLIPDAMGHIKSNGHGGQRGRAWRLRRLGKWPRQRLTSG